MVIQLYSGENKQVYMNNYNGYKTGCSSGLTSAKSSSVCEYQYDDLVDREGGAGYAGGGASSTGNITGIYDINGGAWDYTMTVLNKMSGNTEASNSGYKGKLTDESEFVENARDWQDDKYYNVYISTSSSTACDGAPCKGHAMNEVMRWYGDLSGMVTLTQPWLGRGGWPNDGSSSGVFYYNFSGGNGSYNRSFRIVLTPQN